MNLNKNAIGLRIMQNKGNIVAMHNKGIILQDIADEYDVVVSTIHRYLRKWGVKVKKGVYQHRAKSVKRYKRKFSKEFLANQLLITAINNNSKRFKHFKREDTKSEFNRIRSITKQGVTVI